jgi:hypothetical protein
VISPAQDVHCDYDWRHPQDGSLFSKGNKITANE